MERVPPLDESSIQETFEDEDDEGFVTQDKPGKPLYEVELDDVIREQCKTIIFSEGAQATEFVKYHVKLLSHKHVGKVLKKSKLSEPEANFWGLHYKEPEPSFFYQIDQETILCTSSPVIAPEDLYTFATSIISSFKNQVTVAMLVVSSFSQFRSDEHSVCPELPLIRILATKNSTATGAIPRLEPPNIVGGVTAGMLTMCDIREIPAIACIVYSNSLYLDADIVKGFTKFLQSAESTRHLEMQQVGRVPVCVKSIKTGNLYI